MAEFVKKGSKGAVGTLTKAETLMTKDGPVDTALLRQAIPKDIEGLTSQIKDSHKIAVGQMGRAIIAAARAGQLLLAAKVTLPKEKAFTEWLAETFEFSQRSAYDYMKVADAMARRAEEVVNCGSIRDVLKLCDTETAAKKKKDPKKESFVTWAAKIERYFAEEFAETPLEDWQPERRETCKKMLEGVVRIHAEL